jgi:two-component system NtrC family response regulator
MTETASVLIIDDEDDLRFILKDVLSGEGFSVSEAANGLTGMESFRHAPPHAVLLDLNMPQMNGIDTLAALKQINPKVPVIILTAHGDIPTAVEVMRLGAYDFITKPPDFDRLLLLMKRAVEYYQLEIKANAANAALKSSLESLLGKSSAMKKVIELINYVAQTDVSVVIQGRQAQGKPS